MGELGDLLLCCQCVALRMDDVFIVDSSQGRRKFATLSKESAHWCVLGLLEADTELRQCSLQAAWLPLEQMVKLPVTSVVHIKAAEAGCSCERVCLE